jgi:uncharacterized protein (DUF433 family)
MLPKVLEQGLYSPSRAARLAGTTPGSAGRWLRHSSTPETALLRLELPQYALETNLSFVNLIELKVLCDLRSKGVTLQRVRQAVALLRELYEVRHPLAWTNLLTDGRDVFIRTLEDDGDRGILAASGRHLRNFVIDEAVAPFFKDIDFDDDTGLAARWYPRGRDGCVVIDPLLALGEPVLEKTRVETAALYDHILAGDSPEVVAQWYGLPTAQVVAAARFEKSLLGAA